MDKSDSEFFCPDPENINTGHLAFSWKYIYIYAYQILTDDVRLENAPISLDLAKILKSLLKKNNRRKFTEK